MNDLVSNLEEIKESQPGYHLNEEMNEMDKILETVIHRMRTLQEDFTGNPVAASDFKRRNIRVKRNTEDGGFQFSNSRNNDDFVTGSGILKTLAERSNLKTNPQTIESYISKGRIYDAGILNTLSGRSHLNTNPQNIESYLSKGRMNEDFGTGSGILNTLSERSHLSSSPQTVGSYLATIPGILQDQGVTFDTISKHILNFERSMENVIESGFSKLSDGLDSIVEKMDYSANVEETLHDGFHSIAEMMEDKATDDTIHDGLHEISEKIETINSYGLTGILNSLDSHDHHTFPDGHGFGHDDDHDHIFSRK